MAKKTVLLIEDDEDLTKLYKIFLEKAGFKVLAAANGLDGLTKSAKNKIDIILLDLMMPFSDGKDVLSMVGLNQKTKDVPIIIISNLNPGTYDLSQYDDQVIDYWIKSDITPKTLTAKIANYFS